MEERTGVLTYAVRGRVVLKYCGQLMLMLVMLTLVPLAVALLQGEWLPGRRYAILCCGLLAAGAWLARLPAPSHIQGNEALTVTALAFLIAPLLMSWPMMAAGIPFTDALFEAVSGVTTTGLSTLAGVEQRSSVFLFARAWMQWYGGLGIVVLSVALLMGHHAAARRLVDPAAAGEALVATARTHARRCIFIYLLITLLGLALVWSLTGDGFNALLHVLTAVSTGGFSSFDQSLAGFHSAAAIVVICISLLGAVSLPLYWRAFHAGRSGCIVTILGDVELRALVVAGLLTGALLSWLASRHGVAAP